MAALAPPAALEPPAAIEPPAALEPPVRGRGRAGRGRGRRGRGRGRDLAVQPLGDHNEVRDDAVGHADRNLPAGEPPGGVLNAEALAAPAGEQNVPLGKRILID